MDRFFFFIQLKQLKLTSRLLLCFTGIYFVSMKGKKNENENYWCLVKFLHLVPFNQVLVCLVNIVWLIWKNKLQSGNFRESRSGYSKIQDLEIFGFYQITREALLLFTCVNCVFQLTFIKEITLFKIVIWGDKSSVLRSQISFYGDDYSGKCLLIFFTDNERF